MTPPPAHALETFVDKARRLYSLPAVAMEVLELTGNPQVDTRALKNCIENDPALTTKILRVVNSSLFGLSREVCDLNQALALLGTKPLKLLVLGFSLPDALFSDLAGDVLARYWQRTLTKAVAARELSERFWRLPGDEPFIAGLLQDLGMLALIQSLGAPYVQLVEGAAASGGDLLALEVQSLGFDHTQLSSRLLEGWGLPKTLVAATQSVQSAHEIDSIPAPARCMPQILHLAELLARVLADHRRSALLELLFLAKHYRSLSRPEIDNLVEVLQDKVDQLADVLSLRLPEGRDDRDVLLEAYEQMSDVAMESASDLFHRGRLEPPPLDADQTLLAEVRALAGAASLAVRRAQGESQSLGLKTQSAPAGTDEPAPPQQSTLAVPGTELPPDCQEARSASAATSTASSTPPLDARLAMFVATCRQERWSLSLLMVGIDRLEGVKRTGGPGVVRKILRLVELACGTLDHALLDCFQAGEGQVAVVLPACDRAQAVQYGNTLVRTLPQLFAATSDGGPAISLSVGAATVVVPPKNFPPGELLERASRCLYGARSGGGGGVKSIEII